MLVAAALLSLVGCAGSGPLPTRLRPEVVQPPHGVVLFLCDGLTADLAERGCREGWLPNMHRRFYAGGTRVEHACTVVPSITYAAITSALTGVPPAEHHVTGNRWFDPPERLFRNYATIPHYRDVNSDFDVPTVYERINPSFSVSIQAAHMRGVTRNIANWAQSGVRWFFGVYIGVNALTAVTVDKVAREANRHGHWPALLMCYFPGLDTIGHLHGVSSPEYREAAEHLDHHIGRVCNWLERDGLLETTYLVLFADHGMVDVHARFDLLRLIRDDWGRHATDRMLQDGSRAQRGRYYDRYDTVVAYQDGRKAALYFAGETGWDAPASPQAVEEILTAPAAGTRLWDFAGVDLVAYLASETEAVLRSPRGTSRIVERQTPDGPEYRYVPVPADALGYQEDEDLARFVAAGFHDSRAWLRATARQAFPDVVPHLVPLLRRRRCGQVLVFAAPAYSFVSEAGGHGGLRQHEMRIPLMFAGPGIEPGGTLEYARIVDLVPTIMTWLGVEISEEDGLPGVPLAAEHADEASATIGQP